MLKEERLRHIIERIERDSRIYVSQLSEELGVSDDTLRRDLQELEIQGKLTKVHGGAIAKSGISLNFTERLNTQTLIKRRIAEKAVALFDDGDVIIIDGGTTNLGGQVWGQSQVTIGLQTFEMAKDIYADWSVIGVSDLHPDKGLMTDHREEAITKRYLLLQGAKRMTTATAEKLGTARSYHIASIGEIDIIVTEDDRVDWIKENWKVNKVL